MLNDARVAQFLINRVAIDERIYPSSRRGCRVANGDRSNDFSNPQREKFATNCKYITQIGRRSQVQANVTVSAGYVTFLPFFPLFFFSFFFSLYPFFASFFTRRTFQSVDPSAANATRMKRDRRHCFAFARATRLDDQILSLFKYVIK